MTDKRFDPDDPMQFVGVGMPCDAAAFQCMTESIIEEYLMLGWPDAKILQMFRMPFYQLPHAILKLKGEEWVCETIARVRGLWRGA